MTPHVLSTVQPSDGTDGTKHLYYTDQQLERQTASMEQCCFVLNWEDQASWCFKSLKHRV